IESLALLATFVAQAAGFALLSMRRYRQMLIASSSALVLNVALTLALGSEHGAQGAAVAAVAAEAILAVQLTLALRRHQGPLRVSRRVILALPLAAGAAFATVALPIPSVARVAIAAPLYLGLLQAAGAIPAQLLGLIRVRAS